MSTRTIYVFELIIWKWKYSSLNPINKTPSATVWWNVGHHQLSQTPRTDPIFLPNSGLMRSLITNAGNRSRTYRNNYNHSSGSVSDLTPTSCWLKETTPNLLLPPTGRQRYMTTTHTSDSSFLFFSSFFSFSSSSEVFPFCTSSSFSLTWSSMLSTWGPTQPHCHTHLIQTDKDQ